MCIPLSDNEIEKLRELLEVAETVKQEAEYKMAMRLVLKTWKNIVIGLAATITAVILLKDQLHSVWKFFSGG